MRCVPISRLTFFLYTVLALLFLSACGDEKQSPGDADRSTGPGDESSAVSAPTAPCAGLDAPIFAEAEDSGLDFVYFNGMVGERYYNEMVGGGAALFDADADGDLDVFFVQGEMLGTDDVSAAVFPPAHPLPLTDRLYRNDSAEGELRFTDVTEGAGLGGGYGMGVAAGDVNGDGLTDLYVTRWGSNQLLLSNGDGTFRDVTAAAGVEDPRWSISATFADLDVDGHLDLYVANYVEYSLAGHKRCRSATGAIDYCGPHSFPPVSDSLFRNLGPGPDGVPRFEEVSADAGVGAPGPSLGVVAADLDADGRLDLYVANDGAANWLWLNRSQEGRLRFEEAGLLSGTAFNKDGHAEAGMGVDAGDADNDGDDDLFLAHLTQETNTFYANLGGGQFADATVSTGLGAASFEATGFGTGFFDFDNDGWLDVAVANGAVKVIEEQLRRGDPYPIHQTNQLFRNLGLGEGEPALPVYAEVTECAGPAFERSEVSRGLSYGDVDDDGDTDILVVNSAGPARLLLNRIGSEVPWLGFRVLLPNGRPALGARVELVRRGAPSLHRRVRADGSYVSAHDPRLLFGLGGGDDVVEARVRWPDGTRERFPLPDGTLRTYLDLVAGTGEPADPASPETSP